MLIDRDMNKKRIILTIVSVILVAVIFYNRYFFFALFSVVSSKVSSPDLNYVKMNHWQHDSGFRIGEDDFVTFKGDKSLFQLKQDTIYFRGVPSAIVTQTNEYLYQMIVTTIDGQNKGEYANTSEFAK
jgi:hypothetical protein